VDLFRPSVGFASVKLLQQAGCEVHVPVAQTCCGQPAYNTGDRADTREIAEQVIEAFEAFDFVVAPSGSCASMLKKHYPGLFKGDARMGRARHAIFREMPRADFVSQRRYDAARHRCGKLDAAITYHDSCSGLRELGVQAQPRKLLVRMSTVSKSGKWRIPMSAAVSAARSASNIPISPTPS
jgi:L-lactate dehydrogenase complex protein LldE